MSDYLMVERELLERISMDLAPYSEHAKELRALLTAQPTINGYTCTVPDDCETLHWRGQILSMNELASMAQPAVGEEIHVHIEGQDVLTLPLVSSGMGAPRFVVHVPAHPAGRKDQGEVQRLREAVAEFFHAKQAKADFERDNPGNSTKLWDACLHRVEVAEDAMLDALAASTGQEVK